MHPSFVFLRKRSIFAVQSGYIVLMLLEEKVSRDAHLFYFFTIFASGD